MKFRAALLLAAIGVSSQASARDYCPDRPGIDTPPCTIDLNRLSIEASIGDWTHEASLSDVTDTLIIGDVAMRYGIAEHAEFRLGWTAYGHVRSRDPRSGDIGNLSSTGDIEIGIKRNLIGPTGDGFSIALLPSVSLPVGGRAIGAGDWGAGVQMPISLPFDQHVSFVLTPEIDAAVDSDRHGRHLAYGTAGGFAFSPLKNLNVAIEAAVMRDNDPADAATSAIAGISAGLMLNGNMQVDIGSEFGVNGNAPDRRLYVGVARRF